MAAIPKLKLALGALLLAWALSVFASGPKNGTAQNEPVLESLERQREYLRSKDPKLRQQAISMILEQRRSNISALTSILRYESMYQEHPEIIVDAMRLLGKLRPKEPIVPLVEHFNFQSPRFPSGGGYHILNGREAVDALIEIGKPSVPGVVLMIRETLQEVDLVKFVCAAAVIEGVEGKEAGVLYLEKLIEKETDPKKQTMLRKLKECVQIGADKIH